MKNFLTRLFAANVLVLFMLFISNKPLAANEINNSQEKTHIRNTDSLLELSNQFLANNDFSKALIVLKQAQRISLQEKNHKDQVNILKHIGNVYDESGDYKNAMRYYYSGLEIAESKGLLQLKASLHVNMGVTFFNMKEAERALTEYQIAIETAEAIKDTLTTIKALNNIGNVYMSLYQDTKKSIPFFEKSASLSKAIGYTEGFYAITGNLAQIYTFLGIISSAEKAIDELLEIDSTDAYTLFSLANLYRAKKMPHEALKVMQKTLSYCDNLIELQQVVYKDMSDLYFESSDFENALIHFKKYSELKEKTHDTEIKKFVIDLQKKYQDVKKEAHIEQLEMEKQKTKLMNSFLVFSLVLISGIGLLYYMNYRRKIIIIKQKEAINKQKIHEMEQEKIIAASAATIKGEETERERIARDIHDGLGGLLSGLKLALLNMKTSDDISTDHIKNIDYAMHFLNKSVDEMHRIAYNMMPETLHKFGLNEALETFCNTLNAQNKSCNIVYQFFGQDKRFSKMFELNVYRIAQEIINNSVKYSIAQNIVIQLIVEPDRLFLSVVDDGVGFDTNALKFSSSGSGLKNIKIRSEAFGGSIDINSQLQNGTEIAVEFRNINQTKYIYDKDYNC